jgi:acyl-CoA synthetase (AMP-forming)/AMP-acid ligase II
MGEVCGCGVIGLSDPHWGQQVHAVVVLGAGNGADDKELTAFYRQRLASYKCPRSVEFRDALPKTGTGKVGSKLLVAESVLHG